jgi:hypothetical protein
MRTKAKKKLMIEALVHSLGVVSVACKWISLDRSTHYKWLKEDADYLEKIEDVENIILDMAESMIFNSASRGNVQAQMFILRSKGKKRGWSDDPDAIPTGKSNLDEFYHRLQADRNAEKAEKENQKTLNQGTTINAQLH